MRIFIFFNAVSAIALPASVKSLSLLENKMMEVKNQIEIGSVDKVELLHRRVLITFGHRTHDPYDCSNTR